MTDIEQRLINAADAVIQTGKPCVVHWKGALVTLKLDKAKKNAAKKRPVSMDENWLDALPKRPGVILCDPDELVHTDWLDVWNSDLPEV